MCIHSAFADSPGRAQLDGSRMMGTLSRLSCLSTSSSMVSPTAHASRPLYRSELDLRQQPWPHGVTKPCALGCPTTALQPGLQTQAAGMAAASWHSAPDGLAVEGDDNVAQHQAPVRVAARALDARLRCRAALARVQHQDALHAQLHGSSNSTR